jgi:hypothetical protein
MDYSKVLNNIVKKHKLETLNTESLLSNIADIYARHEVLVSGVIGIINESFVGSNVFIDCPDCGSKTMLGFGECHLCGTSLYESEDDNTKKEEDKLVVAEEPKKKVEKQVEVKETKVDELDDDDMLFDDELEEDTIEEKPEPKKKVAKKAAKKKVAKKKIEVEPEDIEDFEDAMDELLSDDSNVLDDDDDLDFDLD